jgi:kumamolisin
MARRPASRNGRERASEESEGNHGRGPHEGRNYGSGSAPSWLPLLAALLGQTTTNPPPPPSSGAPPPPPPGPTQTTDGQPTATTPNFEEDSRQILAKGEQLLGRVFPNMAMQVVVYLRPSDDKLIEESNALARDPLAKRAHLTREQYAERHGAKFEDVSRVVGHLMQYGLRPAANLNNLRGAARFADRIVLFNGRARDVSDAFGVPLYFVRGKDDGIYTTYLGGLKLPPEVRQSVAAVAGLDSRPIARPQLRLSRPMGVGAQRPIAYTPIEVAQAYGFPSNVTGKGTNIAILELGGGATYRDLATYFQGLGLQMPQIQMIGVGGAGNAPTGDPNGPDGEVTLDIQVAGAIANGAEFSVYFAPNTSAGFLQGVSAAIHDSVNKPSVLSISWGGPESTWTKLDMYSITEAFRAAALMGISVFVAAGDSGSTDGLGTNTPHVDFPASSPWATACGGTSLYTGTSAPPEQVWNEGPSGGATGGGISTIFPAPSYQSGVLFQSTALTGRGLPDVAGCADPYTGYKVLIDGVEEVYGGTSAVAPLWAALTALLNESTGRPLGFLNPLLYQTNLKGALKDITIGNNDETGLVGKYPAGVGWDPCTGFGTPDGVALLATLTS